MANETLTKRAPPRDNELRAVDERPKQWMPPQLLPDPAPSLDYDFRWIRVSTLNNADPMNISSKLREGWVPVRAQDHPEIQMYASGANSRFPDSVEVGGLILCKIPKEFSKQRTEYYRQQTEAQMAAVDNSFMRTADPRVPMFKERNTKVTFGSGT